MYRDGDDYNGLLKLYQNRAATFRNSKSASCRTNLGCHCVTDGAQLLNGEDVPKRQISDGSSAPESYKDYLRPALPDGVFIDTDLSDDELKRCSNRRRQRRHAVKARYPCWLSRRWTSRSLVFMPW